MKYILIALLASSCATFESRFTSHTGCPEKDIKVDKPKLVFWGNQTYTVSCRGEVYHCTESFVQNQHSNLRCAKDNKAMSKASKKKS